MLLEDG